MNERNQLDSWAKQGLNVHKCPQCKAPVEKAGGCQYMTCGNCKYYWCWICGMHCSDHDSKWSMHYFFAPFCSMIEDMPDFNRISKTNKIVGGILFLLIAYLIAEYAFYIVFFMLVTMMMISYIVSGLPMIFEKC